VYWQNPFRSFQFEDKHPIDNKINPSFADLVPFVRNGNSSLTLKRNISQTKLDHERFLVNALKKPRSKHPVNLKCGANYGVRNACPVLLMVPA
jgi:hypothetical protein